MSEPIGQYVRWGELVRWLRGGYGFSLAVVRELSKDGVLVRVRFKEGGRWYYDWQATGERVEAYRRQQSGGEPQ